MNYIKLCYITALSVMSTSCIVSNLLPGTKYVELNMRYGQSYTRGDLVIRSIPHTYQNGSCSGAPNPLNKTSTYYRKYVDFGGRCIMEPGDYVPDEIVIEYAPWLTAQQITAKGLDYNDAQMYAEHRVFPNADDDRYTDNINRLKDLDIAKIPASQWHRIVLHPKQDYATKYNYAPKLDKGWSKYSNNKILQYNIVVNRDGSNNLIPVYGWRDQGDGHWIP
jgi:hypothetical protein